MSDDKETGTDAAAPAPQPLLKVVKGNPTAPELAALIGVLTAAGGGEGAAPAKGPRNQWGNPADKLRPATGLSPDMFYNLRFDY